MKKLVFASTIIAACIGLVQLPSMRAQDRAQDSITVDQVEYNAYQNAVAQSDLKARAAALEGFLTAYPRTVIRNSVLGQLEDLYRSLSDQAMSAAQEAKTQDAQAKAIHDSNDFRSKELDAATRLLAADPNNLKALLLSVMIEKAQGASGKTPDTKMLADAADKAQKGLKAPKPADISAADWRKQTDDAYPIFHSAIGLDATVNKHFDAAIDEFQIELKLDALDATTSGLGLSDTVQLADAYAKSTPVDEQKAIWFYARAWKFAPTGPKIDYKAIIGQQLEYWYNKYHGGLDGLDDVKTKAAASVFPPEDFQIKPKPTLAELISPMIRAGIDSLSLADKETVLAQGFKEDADRVWAKLKDQNTPVPGNVISATATEIKVSVVEAGKTPSQTRTIDYLIKLKTPITCGETTAKDLGVKDLEDLIMRNGFKEDTDRLAAIFSESSARIRKIVLDPSVSAIAVAVTQDAKSANTPDFIVNLKSPMGCKALPSSGSAFGMQPAIELDGTYDSYTKIAATGKTDASVQIVLRDGFIQPEKKKPVQHKAATSAHKASHS